MPALNDTVEFDEAFYLQANPDISEAVDEGLFRTGLDHFLLHGRAEGRLGTPSTVPAGRAFDEAWYLRENPDVADAVANGKALCGLAHWTESGRHEGRLAPPGYVDETEFDAEWYLSAYHAARRDIASGLATDALDHYARLGQHRGYLRNPYAPRPDDAAGIRSRFGGLWLDQANALDLIEGRLQLGRITAEQADQLRHWHAHGYVVLRNAMSGDVVDRAARALHQAYQGEIQGLKFECPTVAGYVPTAWDPAVQSNPAKALDLHWLSEDIRDLVFADPVRVFLELLFERRALATQSLTFLRGSAQGYHQDTLYVPYSLPTQFAASWIALEDVQVGGGELTYFPGSQRIPEILFGNRFKTLWDAQRILRRNSLRDEMKDYSDRLREASVSAGLEPETFLAKKGDVLLWHADLAHGGMPISAAATRASVVTHYCPREVAPLTFERGRTAVREHGSCFYATGYYAG